ncbi:hypothetical protein [Thioclava sp. A2]|uniref:hypothetical protein n=1 Tax=Thioclava sp. FCG-A2 TaxID=3080562 RepID=UPI002955234F|nr:hypothetical protein [Thioclava sp. A2]
MAISSDRIIFHPPKGSGWQTPVKRYSPDYMKSFCQLKVKGFEIRKNFGPISRRTGISAPAFAPFAQQSAQRGLLLQLQRQRITNRQKKAPPLFRGTEPQTF